MNKLLFSQQSSFRLVHSVLTCPLKCTNDWYLNLDNSEYTAVTFIDLKKAFDTVNHDILIQKLEHYGVQNKEIRWFRSYLTNGKQCCKVNGQLSDLESITTGVPHGSCLGSLLFIIYVNDLHFSLRHSDVNMYADDTSLSFSAKSIHSINECVNEDLGYLKSWLNANKLSLNVTKTQSLVIGGRKRLNDIEKVGGVKPLFNVGEETVSIIKEAKYLGVMVDQYLNWKEQITAIKKKVSRGIGMLKYSKRYLPLLTIQSMYKSLVEPYFRYCCPVWGSCGSTAINELQKLQNRSARIVTNSRYDASAKPIIKKLGWHTVSEIIQMETLSMVYKSINDLAPTYLTEMFSRLSDTCKRELRNTRSDLVLQSQLVNIYHALVESHLRYANVVWGSLSNTKLEALQRLQNRAHSIIERAKIKDQWSGDWLTVEQLINFDRSVMTYKMMNKICPESLWDTYRTRNMYSSYRTRNCTNIQLPRYNLEYSKKRFHYSGLKAWNEIPNTIRELSTLQQFKKHLKIHLRS